MRILPLLAICLLKASTAFAELKSIELSSAVTQVLLSDQRLQNSAYIVGTWQGWTVLSMEVECKGPNGEYFQPDEDFENLKTNTKDFRCFVRPNYFSRYPQLSTVEILNFDLKLNFLLLMYKLSLYENVHTEYFYGANIRCNIPTGTPGEPTCTLFDNK